MPTPVLRAVAPLHGRARTDAVTRDDGRTAALVAGQLSLFVSQYTPPLQGARSQ
jgi:hypothetical protein